MTSFVSIHKLPRSERILRNAYRILGVGGEAGWAEIRSAAARDDPGPWDLPFLGAVSRTPAERGLALNRLVDPSQRLRERLFWFHETLSEAAVRDLDPATLRNSMEGWGSTSEATALHDAAVVGLITTLTLDPQVEDVDLWSRVLERWRAVLSAEEYWGAVIRAESQGGFEIPAPFGEIYELREKSLGLVLEIPAGIARKAVLDDDLPLARRAIDALRNAVPEDDFVSLVGDLAKRVTEGRRPEACLEEGGFIPLARSDGRRLDGRLVAPGNEPPVVERSRAIPFRHFNGVPSAASPEPAAVVSQKILDSAAVSEASYGPESSPATEPPHRGASEPSHALASTPWRPSAAERGLLPRPALVTAFALVVVIAALLVLRFGGWAPVDPGTLRSEDATLTELDQRLAAHDAQLAEILLARRVMDEELARFQENARDYRALAEDYQKRIAYRLKVDRRSYARVIQLHNTSVAQYNVLLSERAGLVRRYQVVLDQGEDLVARYNARVR